MLEKVSHRPEMVGLYPQREIRGTNGKFWEDAGISGKNWEKVIEEWEIVGNLGKTGAGVGLFRSFSDHKIPTVPYRTLLYLTAAYQGASDWVLISLGTKWGVPPSQGLPRPAGIRNLPTRSRPIRRPTGRPRPSQAFRSSQPAYFAIPVVRAVKGYFLKSFEIP